MPIRVMPAVWLAVVVVAVGSVAACGNGKGKEPATSPPLTPGVVPTAVAAAPPSQPPSDRLHHHYPIPVDLTNVEELDLAADGERIVAGGEQGGVIVVERTSRKVLRRIAAPWVDSVAISADGAHVVVVGDKKAKLVDVATGKELATHAAQGTVARCGANGWLVARDKQADVLDAQFKQVATLATPDGFGIHGTVACGGGRAVLVAKHALVVFDLASAKQLVRIDVPTDGDANGLVDVVVGTKYIATISNAGSVWLYDVAGKLLATAPIIAGQASRLALSADESLLAAGNVILAPPDLAIRKRMDSGGVAAFTPDAAWLVTARNHDIDVLDVAALDTDPVDGHYDTGSSLAIDPSQAYLASGNGGRVFLWALDKATPGIGTGPLLAILDGHAIGTFDNVSVAFHPDGKRLVSAGYATVVVWDLATRSPLARWSVQTDESYESELGVRVDDRHIVVSGSNYVYVYDATTYKQLARLGSFKTEVMDGSVDNVALHPDGKHVAVTSQGGALAVFDRVSGKRVAQRPAEKEAAERFPIFTPDGKLLIELASTYGRTLTWPKLDSAATFEAPWASDAAWSADGKRLAVGSWNGLGLSVFERAGASLRKKWELQTPWHTAAVAWDNKRGVIYTTGADESIHSWDAATGKHVASWVGAGGDGIDPLVLVGDTLLVYQSEINMLRFFDLAKLEQTAHLDELYLEDDTEPRLIGDRLLVWTSPGKLARFQRDGTTWKALSTWNPPEDYGWAGIGISADGKLAWAIHGETDANDQQTGELYTIDTSTLAVVSKQRAKNFGGAQMRVDPSGKYVAFITGNDEADKLDVWTLSPLKRVRTLQSADGFRDFDFVGIDEIALDGDDPKRWSITTGKSRLDCGGGFHNTLGYSADHKRDVIIRGSSIRVRTLADCKEDAFFYDGERTAAVDEKRLVVSNRGAITVWDLAKHEPVAILRALRDGLWSARTAGHYTPPAHAPMPPAKTP
ncbi:MAG TPA: hypothetical protein VMZ53_16835 [Kofleriaceae bacterium]|nr:hypothetical protein [Kofleriaceae bacterium]